MCTKQTLCIFGPVNMISLCPAFSDMSTILTLYLLVHERLLSLFLSVMLLQYDIRVSCGGEHGYCSFSNLWHRVVWYQWKWDISERFLPTYQTKRRHVPEERNSGRFYVVLMVQIYLRFPNQWLCSAAWLDDFQRYHGLLHHLWRPCLLTAGWCPWPIQPVLK
jgi:hypothetical protein